jgi:hypothetical protein
VIQTLLRMTEVGRQGKLAERQHGQAGRRNAPVHPRLIRRVAAGGDDVALRTGELTERGFSGRPAQSFLGTTIYQLNGLRPLCVP